MSLTSEEVNWLVYRYLLESGFVHSAFVFGHESRIDAAEVDRAHMAPGALISFLQKGLLFTEIDQHITEDGAEIVCDGEFSVLVPHSCRGQKRRRVFDPFDVMEDDFGPAEASPEQFLVLKGHTDIVTLCDWSSASSRLATGSLDGSVRLWDSALAHEDGESKSAHMEGRGSKDPLPSSSECEKIIRLEKVEGASAGAPARPNSPLSVVALAWNPSGSRLAVGFFDGRVGIWDNNGEHKRTMEAHAGPVSSLRWNGVGDTLLSGGLDCKVVAWNPVTGESKQRFAAHAAPVVEADWKSDRVFASCDSSGEIMVWTLGKEEPDAKFNAHNATINCIRWDPTGSYLASCSEDGLVKVWHADTYKCVQSYSDHEKEVCMVAWQPSKESKNVPLLASASLDATVRIWNIQREHSVLVLSRYTHPVILLSFSPSGQHLATGSHDRVHVWSCKNESLAKTFKCDGGVNSLAWNRNGRRIAAALSDSTCAVLDTSDLEV